MFPTQNNEESMALAYRLVVDQRNRVGNPEIDTDFCEI